MAVNYKDIKLEDTNINNKVKKKLILSGILTIGDLESWSIIKLLDIENIDLNDLLNIKAVLIEDYNIHLQEEDLIDYTDMFDPERKSLFKRCDLMIKQRDLLRKERQKSLDSGVKISHGIKEDEQLSLVIKKFLLEMTSSRNNENLAKAVR